MKAPGKPTSAILGLLVGAAVSASGPAVAGAAEGGVAAPAADTPRKLTEEDLAKLRKSVQASKARSIELARQAELKRQEDARRQEEAQRQWVESQRIAAAQEAQRLEEEALAEAEFEAERAQKAAAWNAQKAANERALANSLSRLNNTVARVQAQQAEAVARQREEAQARELAERRRQVELINQATQRQDDEARRLAAQRQQSEQQRAAADVQRKRDEQLRQQAVAERARLQQQRAAQQAQQGTATAQSGITIQSRRTDEVPPPRVEPAKPAAAPTTPQASGDPTRVFLGRTCAAAHAGAATWVGNGSFQVQSEQMGSDGLCRVLIRYRSGSGTGVRQ